MCTDPNGNVYTLSNLGNDPIIADTFHANPYGETNNILLTSYNCSGQMRWAKLIGSSGPGECSPLSIVADSFGHIYMAGDLTNGTLYIGYDTTIPGAVYDQLGLIQFDTSGHFNWIQYVGNNTLATYIATGTLYASLALDNVNNIHLLPYLGSGAVLMLGDTSQYGTYDLKYNSLGNLLSAVRLDLDSEWEVHGAVIDPATNKLYVCGEVNQSFGAGVDTFYAAAFDVSRNLLWQYFSGGGDGIESIIIDNSKHLYFCGGAGPYSGETRFRFNGDSVLAPYDALSIIMKTDTNGTVNWIKHFDSHTSVNYFISITQLPNNKVAAAGTFAGTLYYGIDSLVTPAGDGWNPYLAVVDSTGNLQAIQQILGDGFNNEGTAITSDRVGNIYVGGAVVDSIWAGTPAIPAYHSVGGNSDFFVMKYGVDCSCISMPVANYTDTGTHIVGFTYTGTTTGIDSVVWNFGDGSTSTTTNPIHTFTAVGTYTVCVTVYTSCGNDMSCSNVVVSTVGVPMISLANIQVYPNPTTDELYITGVLQNTNYRLLNVTGVSMQQGVLKYGINTLPVKGFAQGIYILEMTGADGARDIVRVVKE